MKRLLVAQEVELVGIQGLFRAVDDDVNHVASPLLHGIAFAHRPTVALLQIGRPPGYLQMMHRHCPLLGIHTCAEHGGRTEQHTDSAVVHALKNLLPCLFGLGGLDELYLIGRNTHCNQLVLDVLANIPLIRLVSGKVAGKRTVYHGERLISHNTHRWSVRSVRLCL